MKAIVAAAFVAALEPIGSAHAQSITTEVSTSGGASTDAVAAIATQLRAFGELPSNIRFYVESAWAASSDDDSDAFGSAYPYRNRLQIIEAYAEKTGQRAGLIGSIRGGRYRTPFGIYAGSDHAYGGFLRAPLIRYDGYFALSNNFLEHGVDVVAGIPKLTVETSLGAPADVGSAVRRSGLDSVVRVQAFEGPFVVGVSHIRTRPYLPDTFAHGHAEFTGLDVRWMREGVELRGEWLTGRPFDGTTTTGWYADAIVHRFAMGPVTAVARIEQLDYDTVPEFALHARRQTIGARIRIAGGLSTQINVLHNSHPSEEYAAVALDVGVTYSLRRR